MKKPNFILAPAAALVLTLLSGCVTVTTLPVKVDAAAEMTRAERSQAQLRNSVLTAERNRAARQEVNRPYLAGNTEPLAREVKMPDVLRQSVPVTAMFSSQPVDLSTALNQISQASGISVTATADALMPASAFAMKTGSVASPISAPTRVVVRANNTPLWTVLDDVARQSGASWRAVPGGAEFFRIETRSFELMAIPQGATTSSSLGRSGGANTQFESQSKSSFTMADQNIMAGIQKTVEAMLSSGGKLTLAAETQTLTVTDTTEALNKIEQYVKETNRSIGRRVRMVVDVIEVVAKDNNDLGVDWTFMLGTANNALSMSSPVTLAGTQAGNISIGHSTGKYGGTKLVIDALNEVGHVVSRRSFPVMTTSGRPVTQALRSTFNYVDQVQATAIASSVLNTQAQAPTVSQKDETVGTFLTMVPTAKKDGSIFLSVSFDVTSAEPLRPFTVGSGASAVTVQQKTINGTGTIQEVPIRSGRTEVIGGIEVTNSQATSRRMADGLPMIFGGSDSSAISKSVMVILVTAVSEEGI